ncbi:MAG: substrate-binding domain-containing protein [Longimicrobiales bacterium]
MSGGTYGKAGCVWLALLLSACAREAPLVIASTTSLDDTGLLGQLVTAYQQVAPGTQVQVIAVGSGQALELGRRGDADIVIAHSPKAESTFVAEGYSAARCTIAQNSFLLVGPSSDSAGVQGSTDVVDAFRKIAGAGQRFVSRGDHSGTHERETSIWQRTGVQPGPPWYLSIGQGMSETLLHAHEQQAYTLTDIATYAQLRRRIQLVPMVTQDPLLLNRYSVILPRPRRRPANAQLFEWLSGPQAKQILGDFRVEGEQVFTPLERPVCH